jgi:uncharacterized protein YfaS (alpha-2-macroglobulin family)
MRKYAIIFITSIILFSCASENSDENSNDQPLTVTNISFDTSKSESIKQIVFTFNQNVAVIGAVPSNNQINSVSISNGLDKSCTWRFVTLNQMACELSERLKYLSKYEITISKSFTALANNLSKRKTVNISTPVPPVRIDYEGEYDHFPSSITMFDNTNTDIPLSALDEALLLKLPNGTYKDLSVVTSTNKYRKGELKISVDKVTKSLPEGYYEILLPKGFQPSNSQIMLQEDAVLSGFWFSSKYKFHGFACESDDYTKRFENVELLENGILPCAPEKISLKFSMPAGDRKNDSNPHFNPDKQVDWLVGADYKVGRVTREKRIFYHIFYLNGDTSYELDLSKIRSMTGKLIDKPERIVFTTQPATPQWHFDDSFGTVVETDRNGLPSILRRNVEEIHQEVTPINTHEDLLSFLNGNSTNSYKNILKPTASTIKKMSEQSIDFRQHLSSKRGLVHVKLNGISSSPFGPQETSLQTKSFMAQSADHNIAIWHQQDLLLQVVDWQAKPIANVEALLVCEGQTESMVIGSTKEDGTLWVKSKQWQEIYQEHGQQECWVWTQLSNKVSAIKLPSVTNSIRNSQNVFAWSAQPIYQPGEQVRIGLIARSRSNKGLVPVTDLSNFKVELLLPEQNEVVPLKMSTSTSQGFSNTTYDLAKDTPMGYYRIHLTDKRTGAVETVGHFMVAEFTPPEFEQFVKVPAAVKVNQSLKANVSARRMNGVALQNAKVKIRGNIRRSYKVPDAWPDEYEFNSWDDFNKNENDKESLKTVEAKLDDQGNYIFASELLESTIPYGKILLTTEILSDDGEAQAKDSEVLYFSREHYIGTKFDEKTKNLHVIAVDQKGKELSNIDVNIEAFIKTDDRNQPEQLFTTCKLNKLPNTCKIDIDDEAISLVIKSGEANYAWYRDYYTGIITQRNPLELKEKFEIKSKLKSVSVGETAKFELKSSLAGTANFILQAGNIKKVWQQSIQEGINTVELPVNASWLPYARVYASLAVDREVANERTKLKLLNENIQSDYPMRPGQVEELLSSQRFLTTSELITVKSQEQLPEVKLLLDSKEVKAGSEVTLSVTANVDAESQIWLVNEALLPLMRIEEEHYDYNKKLSYDTAFEGGLNFDVLTNHLILDSIFGDDKNSKVYQVAEQMRRRGAASSGLTFNMAAADRGSNKKSKLDFAQSVWLDTVKLNANTAHKVKVKLPQLIGRWKLFALTATPQTMAIDSTSISTVRDVEYFFDAPSSVFNIDKASFAVTQINKGKVKLTDKLYLWVDGKKVNTIDIQLNGNEYKRTHVTLPELASGKHVLMLTSETQPDFATYHDINVLEGVFNQQKTWLVEGSDAGKLISPNNVIPGSVQLNKMQTGQLFPDWNALSSYDKDYPHQCWEQTVSRAISYQFNPASNTAWPEGEGKFKDLIGQNHKYKSYFDMFSYFPFMKADPFLTAYTYLAHSWLEGSSTSIELDKKKMKEVMEEIIEGDEYAQYFNIDAQIQSMALLALAQNKDINLEQALSIRQKLGKSNAQATVLQALALKALGADSSLYENNLMNLISDRYVDTNHNVFNENSEKCLAALTFDHGSKQRESLLSEAILQQQQNGQFGSTFANAICSYALKDSTSGNSSFTPVEYKNSDSVLNYDVNNDSSHWLRMSYQQELQDVDSASSGITITRDLYVQKNDEWHQVTENEQLSVSDIVKTTITINSPLEREHIAITDSIAGGFEAINPALGNQRYIEELGRDWHSHTRIEIREGKAYWYLRHLDKGERKISYYSRVRHVGEFGIAPAKVEAMYRSDVFGLTKSNKIKVTQ